MRARDISSQVQGVLVAAILCTFGPWGCTCKSGASETSAEAPRTPPVPASGEVRSTAGDRIVFAGPAPTGNVQRNLVRTPIGPDPEAGEFTLEEAVENLPTDGPLVLSLRTSVGTVFCDLFADRTPRAVAQFIGLARGIRPYWDATAGAWVHRPYYANTGFHRVIPGYLIQGGDILDDGTGDVGFSLPIEQHDTLRHDRPGRLVLAALNGRVGAQFYITDGAHPELDASQGGTIIGQCIPTDVIARISHVPQLPDNHPTTPVRIMHSVVARHPGGAAGLLQAANAPLPGAGDGHEHEHEHELEDRRWPEVLERIRQQRGAAPPSAPAVPSKPPDAPQ